MVTLRAKPCQVTQSRAWTPIEAILTPVAVHTPVSPGCGSALIPMRGQRVDQRALDRTQVPVQVLPVALEVDRSDSRRAVPARGRSHPRLARPRTARPRVPPGARASAVRCAPRLDAAERHDRRMLHEQQDVLGDARR